MFGWSFYFGSIRKYITLFGSLFNDILIDRVDGNNNTVQSITVPLSYGPKDRYLARLQQNPDLLREANQILPRMTFEIKSIDYDNSRKLNTIGRNKQVGSANNVSNTQYNPVPYNFNISLSILTRNADDACRIVEQILPFFKPEWTTAINLIPEMGIIMDIPIILKSINYQDTYEGSFTDRYAIIWELEFVLKGYIFGPISTQGLITQVDVNFYIPSTNTAAEGVNGVPITVYGNLITNSATVTLSSNGGASIGQFVTSTTYGIPANTSITYINSTALVMSSAYIGANTYAAKLNIYEETPVAEYFTIIPGLDANGNPTSNVSISIPISNITANDNYGYITDFFTNIN